MDSTKMATSPDCSTHVFLFPYPSISHFIPLLDLAHLLLKKGLTVTVLVTTNNLSLLQPLISKHIPGSIHPLVLPPPPSHITSGPSLATRILDTTQFRDPIREWFRAQASPPVAIISGFFVGWTYHLAAELGVPHVAFWPSGANDSLILHHLWNNLSDDEAYSLEEETPIAFPNLPNSPVFPCWQVAETFTICKEDIKNWNFYRDNFSSNSKSWGVIFNSFHDLEGVFIDRVKSGLANDKVWAVGPLALSSVDDLSTTFVRGGSSAIPTNDLTTWLDEKADASVVYVCFGSRVKVTSQQVDALATALESSGVHFVWVTKEDVPKEFDDRVAGKGLIIRGWAPQVAILNHRATGAFMTHCGWNSVLEGVAAGVVLLTWPIGADQFSNAKLVLGELGSAIEAFSDGPRTAPEPKELSRILAASVSSDQPKRARALEMRDAAAKAIRDGGSSSSDLDDLVNRLRKLAHSKT